MSALDWLQEFMDCVAGEYGPEAQRVANEWMEDHADLPTDGTSWKAWRDFRQTWRWSAEDVARAVEAMRDPSAYTERRIVHDAYTDGRPAHELLPEWMARAVLATVSLDRIRAQAKAEALSEVSAECMSRTQEAAGQVREHWRGQEFVDGQDTAYEQISEWCENRALTEGAE